MPNLELWKVLSANFVSQVGSHFLTLALSTFVYQQSGSMVRGALVFVCAYLPSILGAQRIGSWIEIHFHKRTLIWNEVFAAGISLLCALCVSSGLPIGVLCLALGVRSIFSFTGRSLATKWVKAIVTSNPAKSIKLYFLSFFLSTAFSGALAGFLLGRFSILQIAVIDLLTYVLGAGIISTYANIETRTAPPTMDMANSPGKALKVVFASPRLMATFLLVCLSQTLFQGSYTSLVTYLPLTKYSLGASGVGLFQIAASIGIVLGFLANWRFPKLVKIESGSFSVFAVSVISLVALFGASFQNHPGFAWALFLVMNLGYELLWLYGSSEFFAASPQNQTAALQFVLLSSASGLMSFGTLLFAFLLEYASIGSALFSLTVLTLVTGILLIRYGRSKAYSPGLTVEGAAS